MTLTWFAGSLVSQKRLNSFKGPYMGRVLDRFGWIIWRAQEKKRLSIIVAIMDGVMRIVDILKTPV